LIIRKNFRVEIWGRKPRM